MSESAVSIWQPVHIHAGSHAERCTTPGQHPTKASPQPGGTGACAEAHPQYETLQRETDRQTDPHLHLFQHRMVFYPREENPHGIGAVIQKGDASPIQVIGQLVDVCLQLSKG